MNIPQIEPVTSMQRDHKGLLEKLGNGPVFLTLYGKPTAVLLAADAYAKLLDQLEYLEDLADILQGKLDVATGKAQVDILTDEQVEAWLAEDEKIST
ncbi:MAG: hypothetical protein U0350_47100 [Caldilineaceae bacterium]